MRIALNAQKLSLTHAYHAGGISRYIYHLLAELRQSTSPHSFEAFAPRPVADGSLSRTNGFRLTATGPVTEKPALRILWEQLALPVRAVGRFDLVHGLAFALPMAWRGKSIVTILDLSFLRHPEVFNPGNRLYLRLATRLSARRADRILTISEHGKREVVSLLGIPPRRVTVTYCAADERFRPLPSRDVEAFRHGRGLPERFILYLGTLEPRKNVSNLVRAYARLRTDWPHAPKLVLAGAPGWLYHEIFQTIKDLRLADQVLLPGFVSNEEQPLWYNAAAAFAYPSLYEGFGLPPLEAMACGTPVVASNAASLPEVIGEAGLLVPPSDEQALSSCLRRVLEDDVLSSELKQAGLERSAQFSWRRMALETLRSYDEVGS